MKFYFDMDGTIANLYTVDNWLPRLRAEDASCYEEAEPMLDFRYFARLLNAVQRAGHEVGIISWGSMESSADFMQATRKAKIRWLREHLPSVFWDEIHIVKYGAPKHFNCQDNSGILFDDNYHVRELWENYGEAFEPNEIIEVLKSFLE